MIIKIPDKIAKSIEEILTNWCEERTNDECCSCNLLDNELCCFLVDLHQQIENIDSLKGDTYERK